MSTQESGAPSAFGITDFTYVAAGAAVLGSGGGGSYTDALAVLAELAQTQFDPVPVKAYDGTSRGCVLAMMGSPDQGQSLTLQDVKGAIYNTALAMQNAIGGPFSCVIPVEVGALNSLIPLIAGTMNSEFYVVDGDGCGRAVPELVNTTYAASSQLAVSPCILGNQQINPEQAQSVVMNVATADQAEALARGVVTADFGSIAGLAAWPTLDWNGYALQGNYIPGTLSQAWALGQYLLNNTPLTTAQVSAAIQGITGRSATTIATNFYITNVSQTTGGGFDTGVVRLDNAPAGSPSTATYFLYNLNESLILYAANEGAPVALAPDSICYYSESTGRGFSNAQDDLDPFIGTSLKVSLIQVPTAPQLYQAPGVLAGFAALLQKMGYAGPMPSN